MYTRQFIPIILMIFLLPLPLSATAGEVASLIARGDSAQQVMNTREALRLYLAAAKTDGKNPDILWRISKMHTDLAIASKSEKAAIKHADRAIDYARRGVAAGPRHAMAHAVLAVAYGQKAVFVPNTEKMDLSKLLHAHAGTALEIDASNTVAMLVLGIWHREVASLNWMVKLLLKAAYGDVPEASLEESQRLLSRAVELEPRQIMPRIELAKTLIELDQEKEAERHLRTAISLPAGDVHDAKRIAEARGLLKGLT